MGDKLDPEKLLVDRSVSFVTIGKKVGDREYAEVQHDSIKPLTTEEKVEVKE